MVEVSSPMIFYKNAIQKINPGKLTYTRIEAKRMMTATMDLVDEISSGGVEIHLKEDPKANVLHLLKDGVNILDEQYPNLILEVEAEWSLNLLVHSLVCPDVHIQ